MKTIARNRSSMIGSLFVLGGLAAFYFYRRNGGTVRPLISRGTDLVRTAREKFNAVAPSAVADDSGVTSRSRAHEIPMAPEDMDRFPAT